MKKFRVQADIRFSATVTVEAADEYEAEAAVINDPSLAFDPAFSCVDSLEGEVWDVAEQVGE